jgi:transposase
VIAEGRVMKLIVTAGQSGDAPPGDRLLEGFPPMSVQHVVADADYDSDAIRKRVRHREVKTCMKPHPKCKLKKRDDKQR